MKALFLLVASIFLGAQVAQAQVVINVNVADFSFSPANITTAHVGDTIRWHWVSGTHTTTSGSIPAGAAAWNANITSTSMTFQYKLQVEGTYNYVCTPHAPDMAGTIVVSAAGVENTQNSLVRIAPNPANNVVEIALPGQTKDVAVRMLDIQGRMFYEGSVCTGKKLSIPTFDIPTGLYQVTLDFDGQRHAESIVIRH